MKNIFLFIGLFALILTSCGPSYTVVRSETYDASTLAPGKKFAFLESEGQLPAGMMEGDYQTVCKAIADQLIARGFKPDKDADLLLKIGVTQGTEIGTKDAIPDWAPYWVGPRASMYRSYYDNAQIIDYVATKAYLLMDMIDAKSEKVVYDAAVSGDVGDGKLLKDIRTPDSMTKVASGLFKNFPVKAPSTKK